MLDLNFQKRGMEIFAYIQSITPGNSIIRQTWGTLILGPISEFCLLCVHFPFLLLVVNPCVVYWGGGRGF